MKYTTDNFAACRFNPLEDNLLAAYPELAELEIIHGKPVIRQLRYIMALYDPKSPLRKDYPKLDARKYAAAELAGFDLEKEIEYVQALMDFQRGTEEFLALVLYMMSTHYKTKSYVMLNTLEQVWWEYNAGLLKKVTGENSKQELEAIEKKSKLRLEMKAILADIDTYEKEFYGEDEDVKIAAKIQGVTAESIAGLT